MMRTTRKQLRSTVLVMCTAALPACDGFFEVHGVVTRCSDEEPLVGVRVTLHLGEGISSDETQEAFSAPDGSFSVALNEPPSASATLLLEKPGYESTERFFSESPSESIEVCMNAM